MAAPVQGRRTLDDPGRQQTRPERRVEIRRAGEPRMEPRTSLDRLLDRLIGERPHSC
jgi:hypothetical protein